MATRLQVAVHSLPRDLWDAIDPSWELDREAAEEGHRTSNQQWNDFWLRARQRSEARERQGY